MHKIILATAVMMIFCRLTAASQALKNPDIIANTIEQWRVLEISLKSAKPYKDPFNDVEVTALFTGPGGIFIQRPAFWDGNNTWKIRFAPTAPGKWSMRTNASDTRNKGLNNVAATVRCVANESDQEIYKHGFLKVSGNGRYFTYADGTPFFYLGDTHWLYIHERFDTSNVKGIASQFKYTVDKRVEQGFTVYQSEAIQMPHSAASGMHVRNDEEKGSNFSDGFDESDLAGFANIDRKFKYIAEKGLVNANSSVTWALDPADHPSVYKEAYMYKLGRYWCARYGAYPVLWTIAQEIDKNMYDRYDSVTINKWFSLAKGIDDNDAYHHPLGAHMENTSAALASTSWWGNKKYHHWWPVQIQDNMSSPDAARNFWDNIPAKPVVLYESAYEDFWTNAKGARSAGYKAFQYGMFGYGYGANGIWNDTYSDDPADYGTGYEMPGRYLHWYKGANLPGAAQLIHLKEFYQKARWWNLTPRFNDSLWSRFADQGKSLISSDAQKIFVVYFFNDTRATGELRNLDKDDSYTAEWFDPRKGDCTVIGSFKSTDGHWTSPSKPDDEDWILYVHKN